MMENKLHKTRSMPNIGHAGTLPSIFTTPQRVFHGMEPPTQRHVAWSTDKFDQGNQTTPHVPPRAPRNLDDPDVKNFTRLGLVKIGGKCMIVPTIVVKNKTKRKGKQAPKSRKQNCIK